MASKELRFSVESLAPRNGLLIQTLQSGKRSGIPRSHNLGERRQRVPLAERALKLREHRDTLSREVRGRFLYLLTHKDQDDPEK